MNNPEIDKIGNKYWRNEKRQLHRKDGPAIEYHNGGRQWYLNGLRHREGGPAMIYSDGDREWYINGKLHREDGPAIEYFCGNKYWFYYGKEINCKTQEEFLKLIKLRMFW